MYLNSLNKTINVTFIRHSYTLYNDDDRIQGSIDSKLSDKGVSDIGLIDLNDCNYDVYYCCPLVRTKDTLIEILNKYNKSIDDVNIKQDILLTARKYGIFEGLTNSEIEKNYPKLYTEWLQNENIKSDGIESIENVIDRLKLFISKIISFNYNNILVVTHSEFLYALFKYITGLPLNLKSNDMDIKFINCSITYLKIDVIFDKMILILNINDKTYEKIINF